MPLTGEKTVFERALDEASCNNGPSVVSATVQSAMHSSKSTTFCVFLVLIPGHMQQQVNAD